MAMRKGLGKGKGMGYKNLIPTDPRIHKQSAHGMKQPQRLKSMSFPQLKQNGVFLKYQGDADGDGVKNINDCKPFDPKRQDDMPVTEIDQMLGQPELPKETFLQKVGKGAREAGKSAYELTKKGVKYGEDYIAKQRELAKLKKQEELETVQHPLVKQLKKQRDRVAELEFQLSTAEEDSTVKENLQVELDAEREQLRQKQEEVTDIKLEDLGDNELKLLAVRHTPSGGFFADFFGGSSNPYKEELFRRTKERRSLARELNKIEQDQDTLDKEAKQKPESKGLF